MPTRPESDPLNLNLWTNVNGPIGGLRRRHPSSSRAVCVQWGTIVVGERFCPLAYPAKPYVLFRDRHKGNPEQLEPCRGLGSNNASIVTARAYT